MPNIIKKSAILLLIIVMVGVLFRTYNFTKGFAFAHDQDLYSWIAKDILVNHHLRLTGQVTSVDGVFIGPAYYYLIAATYAIFNMNPLSVVLPLTAIGVLNIVCFYWVFKRFYGLKAGIIGAFIEAVSFGLALQDRWSVPTQPTILWSIWFLFIILEFSRGKLKYLWLYAVLVGLVWNIHIALLPIIPIPFLVYLFSGGSLKEKLSKINIKAVVIAFSIFILVISPLIAVEIKRNFSQTKSIIVASQTETGSISGIKRLFKVFNSSGIEIQQAFLSGWKMNYPQILWFGVIITLLVLLKYNKITFPEYLGINSWIIIILLFQFISKKDISEYYFLNLLPLIILVLCLVLKEINVKLLFIVGAVYLGINGFWLVNRSEQDNSYYYQKQVVDYIRDDAKKNNYSCIALNYISGLGVGVGYRYLFWYEGIPLIKPNDKTPIYNIVNPWTMSGNEINVRFGRFGVIKPNNISKVIDSSVCNDPKMVLDPLMGYTE